MRGNTASNRLKSLPPPQHNVPLPPSLQKKLLDHYWQLSPHREREEQVGEGRGREELKEA